MKQRAVPVYICSDRERADHFCRELSVIIKERALNDGSDIIAIPLTRTVMVRGKAYTRIEYDGKGKSFDGGIRSLVNVYLSSGTHAHRLRLSILSEEEVSAVRQSLKGYYGIIGRTVSNSFGRHDFRFGETVIVNGKDCRVSFVGRKCSLLHPFGASAVTLNDAAGITTTYFLSSHRGDFLEVSIQPLRFDYKSLDDIQKLFRNFVVKYFDVVISCQLSAEDIKGIVRSEQVFDVHTVKIRNGSISSFVVSFSDNKDRTVSMTLADLEPSGERILAEALSQKINYLRAFLQSYADKQGRLNGQGSSDKPAVDATSATVTTDTPTSVIRSAKS